MSANHRPILAILPAGAHLTLAERLYIRTLCMASSASRWWSYGPIRRSAAVAHAREVWQSLGAFGTGMVEGAVVVAALLLICGW